MRRRILCFLLTLTFSTVCLSAEFCATNAIELQAHLNTAELNGEADFIRVATGSYVGNFVYDSLAPVGGDAFDLTIVGGYVDFFGNPCGVVHSQAPSLTIIDGNNAGRPMTIISRNGSTIEVRNLAFLNGDATGASTPRGGGLAIYGFGSAHTLSEVVVENNLFIANTADFDSGLHVSFAAFVRIRNNVMVANSAVAVDVASIVTGDVGGHFIGNTILNNTTDGDGDGGIYLGLSSTAQGLVINNILWGNDADDLRVAGGPTYVYNNTIESLQGTPEESIGNVSIAPVFESGFLNYTWSPIPHWSMRGDALRSLCPFPRLLRTGGPYPCSILPVVTE